ncbi:MAG TPA: SH3 domain-containing protein [Pyrinomonadaceae bacterium]|nr:SH3 domain-containing protein [Pyrinomonadaceae bacterium]
MSGKFKSTEVAAVTRLRRRLTFAACALFFFACAFAGAGEAAARNARQTADGGPAKSRILVASGARVRAEPNAGAGEVGRLGLGVVVRELERSGEREKIGAAEDFWYRVAAPGGVEGWVFGALTAPFEESRRVAIYRRLAGERLKPAGEENAASFAERTDLFAFLTRAASELKSRDERGEFELLSLLALHSALDAVPIDKQGEQPYQSFLKTHEPHVVYSEPAGQWFVRADKLWDLQKKYADLPQLGERIAWEAAQIPLPGECEGYLPCHVHLHTLTEGHYLKLYPRGAHAGEALGKIADSLAEIVKSLSSPENPYDVPAVDRAEFRRTLALLRTQLSAAPNPNRDRALQQLDALARHFR